MGIRESWSKRDHIKSWIEVSTVFTNNWMVGFISETADMNYRYLCCKIKNRFTSRHHIFLDHSRTKNNNSIHLTIWHENMYVTSLQAVKFKLHSFVNKSWIHHEYDHNLVDLMCIYELFSWVPLYICGIIVMFYLHISLHLAMYSISLNWTLACTAIYTIDDGVSFICRLWDCSEHYEMTYMYLWR